MCLLVEVLPAGALLVGFLPLVVLLAAEKGMVPAASVFLERREKILPGLEIPEEEKALLLFGVCLCSGILGALPFRLTRLGGIGTCAFGPCRCAGLLVQ